MFFIGYHQLLKVFCTDGPSGTCSKQKTFSLQNQMFYEVVSGDRFRRVSWPRKSPKTITTETKFPDRFRIVSGPTNGNDQGKWEAPIYLFIYIYIYIHMYIYVYI